MRNKVGAAGGRNEQWFVTAEMLTDLLAKMGANAVWPVAAGAMAWVLLRKYAGQPHRSQLRSEEA
jgi:hypothetical protein